MQDRSKVAVQTAASTPLNLAWKWLNRQLGFYSEIYSWLKSAHKLFQTTKSLCRMNFQWQGHRYVLWKKSGFDKKNPMRRHEPWNDLGSYHKNEWEKVHSGFILLGQSCRCTSLFFLPMISEIASKASRIESLIRKTSRGTLKMIRRWMNIERIEALKVDGCIVTRTMIIMETTIILQWIPWEGGSSGADDGWKIANEIGQGRDEEDKGNAWSITDSNYANIIADEKHIGDMYSSPFSFHVHLTVTRLDMILLCT